jgi:hypothetical protein
METARCLCNLFCFFYKRIGKIIRKSSNTVERQDDTTVEKRGHRLCFLRETGSVLKKLCLCEDLLGKKANACRGSTLRAMPLTMQPCTLKTLHADTLLLRLDINGLPDKQC